MLTLVALGVSLAALGVSVLHIAVERRWFERRRAMTIQKVEIVTDGSERSARLIAALPEYLSRLGQKGSLR